LASEDGVNLPPLGIVPTVTSERLSADFWIRVTVISPVVLSVV